MSRIVVQDVDLDADVVELAVDASRYAARVLRLGKGDAVTLLDGRGSLALGEIEGTSGRRVTVRIVTRRHAEGRRPLPRLRLVLGLPKGDKPDDIVRRATELGVAAIHPALSRRSVARPDPERAAARVERWRRIASEATRQCGREEVPEVFDLAPLDEAMEGALDDDDRGLVLWEGEQKRSLSSVLADLSGAAGVSLVVGPEGGLTPREVEGARDLGYDVVTLGPLVLRVETAAVAACAVVQHALGAFEP
jgi:16S rRNA (uracil1498-N3)-methyltransferase